MKTFAIYNDENFGVDTVDARNAREALEKFRKANNLSEYAIRGWWAEEVDA